jgi:molecular chaperone DnaK
MCYQLEKLMKENDDKLADSDKEPLKKAIEKVREAAKGEDTQAIKSAVGELEQASHALSKVLYEAQAAAGQQAGGETGDSGAAQSAGGGDDDAIDAEFEVKD